MSEDQSKASNTAPSHQGQADAQSSFPASHYSAITGYNVSSVYVGNPDGPGHVELESLPWDHASRFGHEFYLAGPDGKLSRATRG
ncbi:hypothetical protein L202_06698 [Cryptococcus amylolentus CBS 6039]|uniref:Uncharacterized protein n=1 Tax=Cryptococcus amylolentus CBS 6039 TaxID=1295533 RepID=A0A1E3HJI3_9TREE|nr:hypothetical protein L202_06698 [Cryptococcus amylolentus CBS 6039]ODN75571.1 hypothetical protein L202_06698 [Cryptococcus amylolentus CBS 6039]